MRQLYYIPLPKLRKQYRQDKERENDFKIALVLIPVELLVLIWMFL